VPSGRHGCLCRTRAVFALIAFLLARACHRCVSMVTEAVCLASGMSACFVFDAGSLPACVCRQDSAAFCDVPAPCLVLTLVFDAGLWTACVSRPDKAAFCFGPVPSSLCVDFDTSVLIAAVSNQHGAFVCDMASAVPDRATMPGFKRCAIP